MYNIPSFNGKEWAQLVALIMLKFEVKELEISESDYLKVDLGTSLVFTRGIEEGIVKIKLENLYEKTSNSSSSN